ncbi:MAG: 2-oxoacid:acceptor oxidoreductase subunit alpha, partial [Bdellovibrionales bacterium]|nr:2-oxoacid:acceptor oxidoreductase subunit alpha [Bdellovibrionales bacterium]
NNIDTKAPIKKLLKNIISISFLSEIFNLDNEVMRAVLKEKFDGDILQLNQSAFKLGIKEAKKQIQNNNIIQISKTKNANKKHPLLIDGNTGAAIGMLTAGCQVFSWYPITPSTSIAENLKKIKPYSKNTMSITQSEDELSAVSMVVGAGWAGARAATATSGPGLSLMSEALGYAYFAEVPLVVCDVQRMGPSTGLPTKTSQGDLSFATQLSHGDCQSIILFPSNPEECFKMNYQSFDIANYLQTPILILSDLDIGMNIQSCPEFSYPESKLETGKLSHIQKKELKNWQRYDDPDKDFIPIRSIPGSLHPYLTRGTGHNKKGDYSEDPKDFSKLLKRLHLKYKSCLKITPPPVVTKTKNSDKKCIQLIAYGSTDQIITEVTEKLKLQGYFAEYLKIQSYPLHTDIIKDFLKDNNKNCFIIEQNASGQMKNLITQVLPEYANQFTGITHYNGLPIDADSVTKKIMENLK